MKYLALSTICCLILSGCSQSSNSRVSQLPEELATEVRNHHLFQLPAGAAVTRDMINNIISELKTERGNGIENVSFMIVTKNPISSEQQAKMSRQITEALMHAGFMESRIINSGACFYADATDHVRVDALNYENANLGSGEWDTSIGDCDEQKDIPQYGYSEKYNLTQMIANKADLVSPRIYKGQEIEASIKAMGEATGSSSSGSVGSSSSSSGS